MRKRNRIPNRLKKFRIENNLKQKHIAEAVGVKACQVSAWENGKAQPTELNKVKLEKLFKSYKKDISITPDLKVKVVDDQAILLKALGLLSQEEIQNNGISSVKLCELINVIRTDLEVKSELKHFNLLNIIRDEFSEDFNALKIQAVEYKDKKGESRPMYNLTLSQAKQVLIRESKQVRRLVIKVLETQEQEILELQGKLIDKEIQKQNTFTNQANNIDDYYYQSLNDFEIFQIKETAINNAVNEILKLAYNESRKDMKIDLMANAIELLKNN